MRPLRRWLQLIVLATLFGCGTDGGLTSEPAVVEIDSGDQTALTTVTSAATGSGDADVDAVADAAIDAVETSTSTANTQPPGTTTPATPTGPSAFLSDLDRLRYDGGCAPRTGEITINGATYPRSLYWSSCGGDDDEIIYQLSKQYTTLTATIGMGDTSPVGSTGTIEIWGDNTRLQTFNINYGQATPITVDVSNVIQLRLLILGSARNEIFTIGDGQLIPSG